MCVMIATMEEVTVLVPWKFERGITTQYITR